MLEEEGDSFREMSTDNCVLQGQEDRGDGQHSGCAWQLLCEGR